MTTEPYTEDLRYRYPLTPDSVVLDCGGYEGTFAEEIERRFGCYVHVLEPVREFYNRTHERLVKWPKVKVHHYGIGGVTGPATFHIKGCMTGAYTGEGEEERVVLLSPKDVLNLVGSNIDLLKLNIEGAEFEVLEYILDEGLTTSFRNIQVQFHGVGDDPIERYHAIRVGLAKTHGLSWDYGWVWQSWRLKGQA